MIRDEFDHRAHDILCIMQYGAPGGIVRDARALHRIGDYLRGKPYAPTVVAIKVAAPCKPLITVKLPTVKM